MSKTIASFQIALGLLGLLIWAWYFATCSGPAQAQLSHLDKLATDTERQAELATDVIDSGAELLAELERSAVLHKTTLLQAEEPLKLATKSLQQWERDLEAYSAIALDASGLADRLAKQLPLRMPDVQVAMQNIAISIPELDVQEQTLRIPVPSVKTGKRPVALDLGLTKLNVDIPTLAVSTDDRVLVVPKTAQLGSRTERLRVPSAVDVTYRPLFAEEGRMLAEASQQLSRSSQNLKQSAATIHQTQGLLRQELPNGLEQTRRVIEQAESALVQLRVKQLPLLRDTLQRQRGKLEQSRGSLQQLSSGVPWFFVIVGLIPVSVLLQGLGQLLYLRQ